MSGKAKGGDDILTGGNNSEENVLFGDAGIMSDHAEWRAFSLAALVKRSHRMDQDGA